MSEHFLFSPPSPVSELLTSHHLSPLYRQTLFLPHHAYLPQLCVEQDRQDYQDGHHPPGHPSLVPALTSVYLSLFNCYELAAAPSCHKTDSPNCAVAAAAVVAAVWVGDSSCRECLTDGWWISSVAPALPSVCGS